MSNGIEDMFNHRNIEANNRKFSSKGVFLKNSQYLLKTPVLEFLLYKVVSLNYSDRNLYYQALC